MSVYKTEQRKQLLDFFTSNPDRQFSVKQIEESLSEVISRSAVYRNLAQLVSEGIISRLIKDGTKELVYQYIHSEACCNSIHMVCVKCGDTAHIADVAAEKLVDAAYRQRGFEIIKNKTVLYGLCANCSKRCHN